MDGIYEEFQKAVDKFLPTFEGAYATVNDLKNRCPDGERNCHFIMLGSLMTSLATNGLWPLPKSGHRIHSIRSLLIVASRMRLENDKGIIMDDRKLVPRDHGGLSNSFGRFPDVFSISQSMHDHSTHDTLPHSVAAL